MEKFRIPLDGEETIRLRYVDGERVNLSGIDCFIFDDGFGTVSMWNVSELSTGYKIVEDTSRRRALNKANALLLKHPESIDKAKNDCIKRGIELPVNR